MTTPRHRLLSATLAAPLLLATAALSGCQGNTTDPTATNEPSASSIVAIGHSGLTGWGSDDTFQDVLANSWATGTNPDVDSIFARMLAAEPGLSAFNFAVSGSNVDSLLETQAKEAVEADPAPKLVIVQSVDNDIRCDGNDADNYGPYRDKLTQVMDILTEGLPDAEIFFISQWASVQTYTDVMLALDPNAAAGTPPCGTIDPVTLQTVPTGVAYLQGQVDAYQQIIVDVCAKYPTCVWDGGAGTSMQLEAADLGPEYNHLSVAGHHKLAELEWAVLAPTLE